MVEVSTQEDQTAIKKYTFGDMTKTVGFI